MLFSNSQVGVDAGLFGPCFSISNITIHDWFW